MPRNSIIPYNPALKKIARMLRKNSTLSEILLWKEIKNKALGIEFHRQAPLLDYIVDFYCHELRLAIEIDGKSHDGAQAVKSDTERQKVLEGYGVTFLRFNDHDVKKDMPNVLRAIEGHVDKELNRK